MKSLNVGILGSGQVAQVLGSGFLKHGHAVMLGTRDPKKLGSWIEATENKGKVGSFSETATFGEVVILAVKGHSALSAIELAGLTNLKNKIIIDPTNPIADAPPTEGVLQFFTGPNESLMEKIQQKLPDSKVVKAFSCVGNPSMVNPQLKEGQPTMFICGNDKDSKKLVTEILTQFGWDTADMGGVTAARAIEPLCMLWCIPGFTQNSWAHAFKLLRR